MKRSSKHICTLLVLIFLILIHTSASTAPIIPLKDKYKNQAGQKTVEFDQGQASEPYYSSVFSKYQEKGYKPVEDMVITLKPDKITASDKGDVPLSSGIGNKADPVLVWNEDCDWFEWTVNIPQEGLYEILLEYYPLQGTGSTIQRELSIDGRIPFMEAHNVIFPRMWRDEGEPKVNNIGDEVRPRQIEVPSWQTVAFSDNQGVYADPFQFYLSKGKHTVRLKYVNEPVAFGNMIIKTPDIIPSYEDLLEQYKQNDYSYAETRTGIIFEAEDTLVKTDPTIRQESNGDPMVQPIALGNIKLNVIGDWRWRKGNQAITWEFNVPENGLYKIGMHVGQWWGDGLPVYRRIAIDGKVPFSEMKEYSFEYDRNWRTETLSDSSGQPYMFYLQKGKHQLTMTVKLGEIGEVVHNLMDDALLLSRVIRQIIMITGSEPDPNFQYELDKDVPDLLDNLKLLSNSMKKQVDALTAISVKRPSVANNFLMIKDQLDKMIRRPDSIAKGLNDLINAQSSIGSWMRDIQNQPLVIDYFTVASPDKQLSNVRSTILQKADVTWYNFVRSFSKDYDSVGSVYTQERKQNTTLKVWVSRGKEWAEIIKEMADEDFTPKTGIRINMNVMPAGQLNTGGVNALLLAISSGKAPDVACGVDGASPVEYAIRDATVDLSQFEDFPRITKRFLSGAMVPFQYMGGIYALPETMDFNVLFYRKDIMNELGLSIPNTWEELYKNVLPVLLQNGMEFFYPLGPGGLLPFLYQQGGSFYNADGTKSALDSPEAYKAFKEWTELYTNYKVPVQADFFNRMRTGEIPIGVGGYNQYVLLSTAAPELFGRWGIAPMLGHQKGDGTVNRTAGGMPQAAIILKQSEYPKEAWEFLKWWTSDDVQMRFGRELEALLGVEARWNTANTAAFKGLPWPKEDIQVITQQWNWYKEQPVVLGGYFTSRHINNAWNRVVLGEMDVRDSLEQAIKDINKELNAKQEEFGVKTTQRTLQTPSKQEQEVLSYGR
ncbi:extracellular solute-binding protein [Mahella australiensis]|uniref:Extracellular solute-binding protein family 1 n=1 Tax=Mahella australiensis (strain DSM 15567 / CIP 107919 / 50-1 BON) TaxID=697281 RepID=F4A329_MAHA5|nr:extracellular solute-binding protein [Mahella australiensis]AEE95244.1 extracellular solute-binding protein family 1 [Mahella australiensis 50-1 BON]